MHVQLSNSMLKTIALHVHETRMSRGILDVYKSAEIIRLENISDNVAREDIIEKLVLLAGSANVAIEFNRRAFASERACYDFAVFIKGAGFMESLLPDVESVH